MLSQLSYSPKLIRKNFLMTRGRMITASRQMVGLDRIELSTSPLSGVRSSHLSYRPKCCPTAQHLVELVGIEPATS